MGIDESIPISFHSEVNKVADHTAQHKEVGICLYEGMTKRSLRHTERKAQNTFSRISNANSGHRRAPDKAGKDYLHGNGFDRCDCRC